MKGRRGSPMAWKKPSPELEGIIETAVEPYGCEEERGCGTGSDEHAKRTGGSWFSLNSIASIQLPFSENIEPVVCIL
jgi:hypothetical protein